MNSTLKRNGLLALTLAAGLVTFASGAFAADGKMLAERHVGRGLPCQMCHKAMPPKALPKAEQSKNCEQCHGKIANVAKKTDKKDINPHASHVEEAQCLECHQGHKKPQLLCDQCHEFKEIRVP